MLSVVLLTISFSPLVMMGQLGPGGQWALSEGREGAGAGDIKHETISEV